MKTIKLKINNPMAGYAAGQVATIQVDAKRVPLEKFWRRRIKDAEIDNCVEIVKNSKPKQEKS